MSFALLKSLAVLIPVSILFARSTVTFTKERTLPSALQFFGVACLVVVVLAHICEALELFPLMGWGERDSRGHYLNLAGTILGLALLPLGYLLRVLVARNHRAAL
jgi:hypothetical protein